VERFFNKLKQFRGIATQYDKNPDNFLAAIKLVSARIWILEETPWRAKPPADGPTVLIGFPYPRRFFVWEPKEDITPYELAQAMPFLFRLNEDPLARPYDLTTLGTSVFRHFRFEIG